MPIVVDGLNRRGLAKLWKDLGYKRGCEIGVLAGTMTDVMFQEIPGLHMTLVDPYKRYSDGVRYKDGLDKAEQMAEELLKDRDVTWIKGRSEDVHPMIPDSSLDFIYIDGNHIYDWVMTDIILWSRKVRKHGMISGHDYTVRMHGRKPVKEATNDYVKRHGISPWYITDRTAREFHADKHASWFWFVE